MTDLTDKVAVVTGASSGIGASIVIELLQIGMKVVGLARRKAKVEELGKGFAGNLFALETDINNEQDILYAFNWIEKNVGPIYAFINNAGVAYFSPIDQAETDGIRSVIDTNLVALTLCTREAIKNMKVNNVSGTIININSVAGHYIGGLPHVTTYYASKFGVTAFTESVRLELAQSGSNIRISSLSPGLVESEMTTQLTDKHPYIKNKDIAEGVKYILMQPSSVNVVGLARRKAKVEELGKGFGGNLFALETDVTKEQDILDAFNWVEKNVGPIYAFINNAGVAYRSPIDQSETDGIRSVIDTNLVALTLCTREAIKNMKANDVDGTIININSVCGHYIRSHPGISTYFASKYAVTAFTESIRLELAQSGSKIRISSLSPGLVESEMTTALTDKHPYIKNKDIAEAVKYILTQPANVNIAELTIRPVSEVL